MFTQAKILAFIGPLLLILLTAIAGYAYTQSSLLSLPIPQSLSIATVLLPLIAGLSTRTLQLLLHPTTTPFSSAIARPATRPTLTIISILAAQLIYETVIITLSLTYWAPNAAQRCGLESRWRSLFQSKNSNAIRRIQDSFQCCGFNSPRDQAWPFPGHDTDAGECQRRLGSGTFCGPRWRGAEMKNAGLFFMVALVVFILKVIAVAAIFNQTAERMPRWMRAFGRHQLLAAETPDEEEQDPRAVMRGLIDDGAASAEDAVAENGAEIENFRDEGNGSHGNNGGRMTIQPSALLGSQVVGGDGWRDNDSK